MARLRGLANITNGRKWQELGRTHMRQNACDVRRVPAGSAITRRSIAVPRIPQHFDQKRNVIAKRCSKCSVDRRRTLRWSMQVSSVKIGAAPVLRGSASEASSAHAANPLTLAAMSLGYAVVHRHACLARNRGRRARRSQPRHLPRRSAALSMCSPAIGCILSSRAITRSPLAEQRGSH